MDGSERAAPRELKVQATSGYRTSTIPEVSGPTVLIMAAGEGTRMHSSVPKMLHPVCGRPMVAWPVLAAQEAGAERVCVIVSPERDLSAALPARCS